MGMFTNRQVKVITKFGLTEGFSPERGIDQGEVISSFLWRIYFDPLLCKLHKCKQGAKARLKWPIEITQGKKEKEEIRVAGLAYADDTALMANSKTSMQTLVNTAESFFRLNNIEINRKKNRITSDKWKKQNRRKSDLH